MSEQVKGMSVVIRAVTARAFPGAAPPPPPTPSVLVGNMLRHLKGLLASAEELRALLEKQERSP